MIRRRKAGPAEAAAGYTIGITIFVNRDGTLGLFENGLRQNVLFLYQMFLAAPGCKQVFLLNHGDGEPTNPLVEAGIPADTIVRSHQVLDQLDYVISVGSALDPLTVEQLKARNVPIISYRCGNGGVIAMEAMCAQPPRGDAERYFDAGYFDAIWMTPQHLHTYRGWCETVFRAPVEAVPQIWSPFFVDQRPAHVRASYGFSAKGRPWRIGILDPNITVMKTSHMPMLVCEAAYRQAPAEFSAIYVTNSVQFARHGHFAAFHASLEAAKAGVMTLEPRYVGIDMIAEHCDAVVTHHWENGLNYLYYEVLHGGYPLVHNSSFLKDYGYYYGDFDAEDGARQLLRAIAGHEANLESYRQAVSGLVATLDPASIENIHLHENLLRRVKADCR